jgi:hypothetical protein
MNSALIIGIILIILGIGLAVVAYLVITSSDEEEDDQPEIPDADEPESATEPEPEISEQDDEESEAEPEPVEPEESEVPASIEPAQIDVPDEEEPELADEQAESPAEKIDEDDTAVEDYAPGAPDRIQVATLLRDDVSGQLIIRVGDREYSSPDDLRASPDWTRVEYAASDLAEWVRPTAQKAPGAKEGASEADNQTVERKPSTMIEQINSILQEMIEASGRTELAVRLIEGPGGMARVLIGVNSYEIAEVPDPEVQDLIRQAVASWEANQ